MNAKQLLQIAPFIFTLAPLSLASISTTQTISTLPNSQNQVLISGLTYFPPNSLENVGQPGGRRRGGGGRGPCLKYQPLTALVPENNGGTTTAAHPTFWFYIPDKLTHDVSIQFALRDRNENDIYKTTFKPPITAPGVISISIPATTPALKPGQSYQWGLSIYCDPTNSTANIFVQGFIQRVAASPELQQQLKSVQTPLDRAILYAKNGIWFEALTTLANQMRQPGKTDAAIATAWTDLLKQGKLENIATAPIRPCCTLK